MIDGCKKRGELNHDLLTKRLTKDPSAMTRNRPRQESESTAPKMGRKLDRKVQK